MIENAKKQQGTNDNGEGIKIVANKDRKRVGNMMSKKRWIGMLTMAALFAGLMAMPVMAASRKKIKSVNIKVEASITPETRIGSEDIDVDVKDSSKYSYDTYEVNNSGFEWVATDVPEITIYLRAEDGYYFSVTKLSDIKLDGATLVKASKADSSETLKVVVKLPSLSEYVADFSEEETVNLTNNGFATWNPISGAGSYEVMVYRDGNAVGVTARTTTETNYNLKNEVTRAASYQVKVRPVNGENASNKGKWVESNVVSYNADQVKAIRAGEAGGLPVSGEWKSDNNGWWYQHSDGTYSKNAWEEIDGKWYVFDENGYMRTGWIDWNGEQYYCDNSGAMLKNTTTPDGYILDYDGRIKRN